MKNRYHPFFLKLHNWRLLAFLGALLTLIATQSVLYGQPSPETVFAFDENGPKGYSPTIAAGPGGQLIAAYTVDNGSNRRIQISVSTDEGVTWSAKASTTIPAPSTITTLGGSATDMDDPQIVRTPYGYILVARAWRAHNSSQTEYYSKGQAYHGQNGTVFYKSGIYVCASTDDGATWGIDDGNGGLVADWLPIVEENSSSSNAATLGHPRLSFRDDYRDYVDDDRNLFVVLTYERRSFGSNNFPVEGTGINTKIGVRLLSASNDGNFELGAPITNTTGVGSFTEFDFSVNSNFSTNPMKPSNAQSPDAIWLAYYNVESFTSATAKYFVQKGVVSLAYDQNGYILSARVDFPHTAKVVGQSSTTTFTLPGKYDNTRGYFYSDEFEDVPGYDESPNAEDEFNIEFDQGPSIQVAVQTFNDCSPEYTVGVVFTKARSADKQTRHNSFWAAKATANTTPANLLWQTQDEIVDDEAQSKQAAVDEAPSGEGGHVMLWFPHLGVTTERDAQHGPETYREDMTVDYPSYFVITYMYGFRCPADEHDHKMNKLDWAYCKTALSFDGLTFDKTNFVKRAEQKFENGSGHEVNTRYWGTRLSNTGNSDLQTFPVWRGVQINHGLVVGPPEDIKANVAGGLEVLGYLENYPYNSGESYANGASVSVTITPNTTTKTLPYRYFDFDNIAKPSAMSATADYSYPVVNNDIKRGTFQRSNTSFLPSMNSPIRYGRYYANYKAKDKLDRGLLGMSHQRKLVMTGSVGHCVFEDDGKVYYMISRDRSGSDRSWSQPAILEDVSGVTQYRPSIAVYQNSTGSAFSGEAAIAVVWTETAVSPGTLSLNNVTSKIKMRVREFNTCTGEYGPWSSVREISTLAHTDVSFDDDQTSAVVNPLIEYKVGQSLDNTLPVTSLRGWTVSWTGPSAAGELTHSKIRTRTLKRLMADNLSWGFVLQFGNDLTATNDIHTSPQSWTYPSFPLQLKHPSAVYSENKDGKEDVNNDRNYRQELTWSASTGILVLSQPYHKTGSSLGQLKNGLAPIVNIGAPMSGYSAFERNPCITINDRGQRFVAWEIAMSGASTLGGIPVEHYAAIKIAQTDYATTLWNKKTIKTVVMERVGNVLPEWLLNPSITGYPKSAMNDEELLGSVDLFYWKKQKYEKINNVWQTTTVNDVISLQYQEIDVGIGEWGQKPGGNGVPKGQWTHTSFAPYTTSESILLSNAELTTSQFATPKFAGAYKGTYDTLQPFRVYRTETRYLGGDWVKFIWGDLYVVDSLTGFRRQVRFHHGQDTSGHGTYTALRDSAFRTEYFDVPQGSRIEFYRGMYTSDSLSLVSGGSFYADARPITYTIEAVHKSGSIQVMETRTFDPANGTLFGPSIGATGHNLGTSDTVYVRVRVTTTLPDVDTAVEYEHQMMYGEYPTSSQHSVAWKRAIESLEGNSKDGRFMLLPAYPNPVQAGSTFSAIAIRKADMWLEWSLVDPLGRIVSKSDREFGVAGWKELKVQAPETPGTYYLYVETAVGSEIVPIAVVR